jgi:hypothetical protein
VVAYFPLLGHATSSLPGVAGKSGFLRFLDRLPATSDHTARNIDMTKTIVHVHLKANLAQDAAMELAQLISRDALTYQVGDIVEGPNGKRYRIHKIERVTSGGADSPPDT